MTVMERVLEASRAYLERNGYELVEGMESGAFDLVAKDEDGIMHLVSCAHFCNCDIDEFERRRLLTPEEQREVERNLIDFAIANCPISGNVSLVADRIDVLIIAGERAILRHHINVMSR